MSEVDLSAGIMLGTGADADAMADPTARKFTAMIPIQKAVGAPTPGASGIAVLSLDGPNQGRWWDVVSVSVMGGDDHTNGANTFASLYATAMPTQLLGGGQVPPFSDLIWPGSNGAVPNSLPVRFGFSRRSMALLYPKKLVVVVQGSGASAISNFVATLTGWDRDIDELQDWSSVPSDAYDRAER